jgi:hypothetical protein
MKDASGRNDVWLRVTERFVTWLEDCRPLQSENVRQLFVERLARRFGGSLPRRGQPTVHLELIELVEVCAGRQACTAQAMRVAERSPVLTRSGTRDKSPNGVGEPCRRGAAPVPRVTPATAGGACATDGVSACASTRWDRP